MWPSKDSEILQGFIMTKNVAFILNSLNFCTIQVCCRHTAHGLRLNQKYFAMLKIFLPPPPPPYTIYPAIQHSNKNKTQIKLLLVPRCKSSAFLTWCWLSRRYKNCHPPFHHPPAPGPDFWESFAIFSVPLRSFQASVNVRDTADYTTLTKARWLTVNTAPIVPVHSWRGLGVVMGTGDA